MTESRIRLLYVCDFSSVHSRALIGYFAAMPEYFEVHVMSTTAAAPMANVYLSALAGPTGSSIRTGLLGRAAYRFSLAFPRAYVWLRGREILRAAQVQSAKAIELLGDLQPHVIHALRTQPEGLIGATLKRRMPGTPFLLTTWGQDFVVWGRSGAAMRAATREALSQVEHLLPDNPRDARLAVDEFGAAPASVTVMPATGGLDLDDASELKAGPDISAMPGRPSMLSMRGYENAYVRIRVLLQALRLFLRRHPAAHLYIDGPAGHPGKAAVQRWVSRFGLERNVTLVHLNRATLFAYMRGTDLNVSATRSDGLPISVLEALYFGQVPVIAASESTSPPVEDGFNGVTVAALDPRDIAEGWTRSLELVGNRPSRTEANRVMIRARYDRAQRLRWLGDFYRTLAVGSNSRRDHRPPEDPCF